MLAEAPQRVEQMVKHSEGDTISAADFLPETIDLPHLRQAAAGCEGCELYRDATQTVFGEGAPDADLMLIGEQPGDKEDIQGKPFVGPAGRLLDEALEAAGLHRDDIYITNAVKHFRFLYHESFRQHRSPSSYHIRACKPWLEAEIATVKPKAILCLGNIAARALIGPGFTMKKGRGVWVAVTPPVSATYHPASILRSRDEQRDLQRSQLFEDIAAAAKRARKAA
jgi:uracil-DNA glycosylase family protein